MNRSWRAMLLLCIAIIALLPFVLFGSIFHAALALGGVVGVGLALLVAIPMMIRPEKRLFLNLLFWTMPCIAIVLSFVAGVFYLKLRLHHARATLQPVIAHIETAKLREGKFPASVDSEIAQADLPWFVRGRVSYVCNNQVPSFMFTYWGAFLDAYFYDFKNRVWIRD